jgi:hypothetical protein
MRTARVLTAVGTAVAMSALLPPGLAAASSLQCTDTVTSTVVLTADLRCAGSGPSVVGPDGVLDLGGHRLLGSGTGSGVRLEEGQVENGTVTGFGIGVEGSGTVVDLRVTRNTGIGMGQTRALGHLTVLRSSVTDNAGVGINSNGTVTDSLVARNGGGLHTGVLSVVTVRNSTFRDNRGWGISSDDTVLRLADSRITGNAEGGIKGFMLYGSTIRGNRIADQPTGPGFDASGWTLQSTTIKDNTFTNNQVGLLARGVGPFSQGGPISGNRFVGNLAAGMWLEDSAAVASSDAQLNVVGNTFTGNGFASDGLVDASGRAVDDGLHLDVVGLRVDVGDNVATRNAGHGIAAYDDAADDGGNRARANGQAPQCVGVVCS